MIFSFSQGDNGTAAMVNSWVTSVTSMKSTDGGASWALNTVAGNHTVAHPRLPLDGLGCPFANAAYLHAANMTGLQQITRPLRGRVILLRDRESLPARLHPN